MLPIQQTTLQLFRGAANRISRQCLAQPAYLLEDTIAAVEDICKVWFDQPVYVLGRADPTLGHLPSFSRYYQNKTALPAQIYGQEKEKCYEEFGEIYMHLQALRDGGIIAQSVVPMSLHAALLGSDASLLLDHLRSDDVDLHEDTMSSRAAIHWAIAHNDMTALKSVLSMGAIADRRALHVAAAHKASPELYDALKAIGADMSLPDALGRNAVQVAVRHENAEFLRWVGEGLVDYVAHADHLGRNILHYIAICQSDYLFTMMLDHLMSLYGSDKLQEQLFTVCDSAHRTPMYYLCESGRLERVQRVNQLGNLPQVPDAYVLRVDGTIKWTLFEAMVDSGNFELLSYMLQTSGDSASEAITFCNEYGNLLHRAVYNGNVSMFRVLFQRGVNPFTLDARKLSPAHVAILLDSLTLLECWYINVAALAAPVYPEEWLPLLHFSVCHEQLASLRWLLTAGERATSIDALGWSATDIAWFIGFKEGLAVLQEFQVSSPSATSYIVGHGPQCGAPPEASIAAGRKKYPVCMAPPLTDGYELRIRFGKVAPTPGGEATPPVTLLDGQTIAAAAVTVSDPAGQGSIQGGLCAWSSVGEPTYVGEGGMAVPDLCVTMEKLSELRLRFSVRISRLGSEKSTSSDTYRMADATARPLGIAGYTEMLAAAIREEHPLSPSHAREDPKRFIPKLSGSLSLPLFSATRATVIGHFHLQFFIVCPVSKPVESPLISPASTSSSIDKTFWDVPRLFGHRGSGADNAAVVKVPTDVHGGAAAVTGYSNNRRTHFQENTLESLVYAAKAGAEFVEYDVMLSRDGVPVIHHDWGVRLPSKTHIRVPVSHLTAEQFLSIPPQVMTNDPATDETNIARAADVAALHKHVVNERAQRKRSRRAHPVPVPSHNPLLSPTYMANKKRSDALGLELTRGLPTEVLDLSYTLGLRDRFVSLEEVLKRVPTATGANIEVKYPTSYEIALFGIRPPERNYFIQRILDTIAESKIERPIMFSSFDPDICITLTRSQNTYPVFFLTEAANCDFPLPDVRMRSLAAAVGFAASHRLFGIVTDVSPLIGAPSLINFIQEGSGLVLCSYGRKNNDPSVVSMQYAHGIGAVIADHVAHITRSLRASKASSAFA